MKCPKCGFDTPPTQIRKAGMCKSCVRKEGEAK